MPRWLMYLVVLVIGVAIGYAYMTVQGEQLVDRIAEVEAELSEVRTSAGEARETIEALRIDLRESTKLIEEQASEMLALSEALEAARSAE